MPQLFCRCAACANNWPGMSFSVDKRPLVRQLSPGFAAGQCGVRPMALRKQPTRAFPSENPARDIHAAQQAHRHLQRSGPAKNGFDATKELPAASARCCRTFHPAPRWPQLVLPRARQAPRGSGCSSNVLSIHSGSSRAPRFVGISCFSLAESSSWVAGNPVPSTRAWPGANR